MVLCRGGAEDSDKEVSCIICEEFACMACIKLWIPKPTSKPMGVFCDVYT